MRTMLFTWRGLRIQCYPALLYLGMLGAIVVSNVAAHKAGIDALRVFVADLVLIAPALVGARLLYVAANSHHYRPDLRLIWKRHQGGAVQYGGLALMLPVSMLVLVALQIPFGVFWDISTPALLVGMIFGRIGCLLHGCCAGRPSRAWLSVYLPNERGVWERRIGLPSWWSW
jgi:phosphatidylglycerol:prolipoprotein diacylglycerol transferase